MLGAGVPGPSSRGGPASRCASRGRAWSGRRSYKTRAPRAGTGSARGPPFRLQNAGARPGAPAGGSPVDPGGASRHLPPSVFASQRSPPKGASAAPTPSPRPPLPPPGLARGEEPESRWPDPAACATRAGAGGSGQGTRSRAPVGRAHSPPFPAPPRPPRSRWLQESIVTADFSRQLQLSNSSANN